MDPSKNTNKTKKSQFGCSVFAVLISLQRISQPTPSNIQLGKKLEAKSSHDLIYESNEMKKEAKVNKGKYVVRRDNKLCIETLKKKNILVIK